MVECETSFLMRAVVYGLDHARTRIASWIADYNEQRLHPALGYLTPEAMSAISPQDAIVCATLTSSADRMLLHTRQTE